MAERFLIDTSAAIKYLNESLPTNGSSIMDKILDDESNISFVTEIELQGWDPPNPNDIIVFELFVSKSAVIGVDKRIIQETIRIRKLYKIKLPDALIAATAITNDMTLVADNDKDYKRVPELKYLNPGTANV